MERINQIPNKIIQQDLSNLIKDKKLTYDVLSNLTKVNSQWFADFIDGKKVDSLSEETVHYINDLISILSLGSDIDIDTRLKSILEVFEQIYEMDIAVLANCIGIEKEIILNFMQNSKCVSTEQKYELAVKVMFLYYIFKFPDYTKC